MGQFKELVESSETDQPLQETLKKVLNFTSNGWHKAREHAMRAVSTDNRMRAWCADDSLEDGLLFKCYLGRVDLEAPVGQSQHATHNAADAPLTRLQCTSYKTAAAPFTKLQMQQSHTLLMQHLKTANTPLSKLQMQHAHGCRRYTTASMLHSWA